MSNDREIEKLLNRFSDDNDYNLQLIYRYICAKDFSVGAFLHQITGDKYDEKKAYQAIDLLLSDDSSSINELDGYKRNIVQNAINSNYSVGFVTKLMLLGTDSKLENRLDVNNVDDMGNTILHAAIYADDFKADIYALLRFMLMLKFDCSVLDKEGRSILDAMKYEQNRTNKFSDKEIMNVEYLLDKNTSKQYRLKNKSALELSFSARIQNMLNKLEGNDHNDYHIIKAFCNKEFIKTQDLLYCLSTHRYNDEKCSYAITSLVNNGNDINYTPNNGMNSFFQNLVENGYSQKFVFNLLHYIVKMKKVNVDLNYKNKDGDTIAFTAIKSGVYGKADVLGFIYEAKKYGYDVNIEDGGDRDIFQAIDYYDYGGDSVEFAPVTKKGKNGKVKETVQGLNKNSVEDLEEYGKVLNSKKYEVEPVIGRENELKNLMVTLAQDKKNPIIVGKSGVGKTVLVEELAYKIGKGEVPNFLKNKIIFEVNPSDLVAGCKYVGQFEEKMKTIFDLVIEYDVVLFIDEIHTIYGIGTTESKNNGLESMIKQFVDRNDVKVIGTTTQEEYEKYFSKDALKRRFEKIKVDEPSDDVLRKIVKKVMNDYCYKSGLDFVDEYSKKRIVDAIMFVTDKSHRVYNDKVNNPDLAVSIIDKAFAFAKYNDLDNIDENCFREALDYCDRIYETARKSAKSMLKKEVENKGLKSSNKSARIVELDFIKNKKR